MYESYDSGLLGAIGAVGVIFYLAILVLVVAGIWKLFEKAGKPGWAAIIPIYNIVIWCEIVGKPAWWVIFCFIPLANLIVLIILINLLSKSFGKGVGYTIGLIIFPFIFYPVLGFGSATYQGPAGQ